MGMRIRDDFMPRMNPRCRSVAVCLGLALCASIISLTGAAAISIHMVDIAAPSGLTAENTSGGRDRKVSILETTGNGAAIFDYDGDGANDLFLANGTTLEGNAKGTPRISRLYHNDGHGNFTDVSREAGFT